MRPPRGQRSRRRRRTSLAERRRARRRRSPGYGSELAYLAPFTGFSYSLVSSMLSGNLLQLAFVPLQVFQSWCAIQDASMPHNRYGCICDAGACTPPSNPIRQLTLTVSGDSMQGQLLGLGAGPHDINSSEFNREEPARLRGFEVLRIAFISLEHAGSAEDLAAIARATRAIAAVESEKRADGKVWRW
jgi:hypothetical protein